MVLLALFCRVTVTTKKKKTLLHYLEARIASDIALKVIFMLGGTSVWFL